MAARTKDCIYLHPNNNQQGSHLVMDIATGQVISRHKVYRVPITDTVVKAVNSMGYREGFCGLKVTNRNGHQFGPNLIEGVDNTETEGVPLLTTIAEEPDEAYEPDEADANEDDTLKYDNDIDDEEPSDRSIFSKVYVKQNVTPIT